MTMMPNLIKPQNCEADTRLHRRGSIGVSILRISSPSLYLFMKPRFKKTHFPTKNIPPRWLVFQFTLTLPSFMYVHQQSEMHSASNLSLSVRPWNPDKYHPLRYFNDFKLVPLKNDTPGTPSSSRFGAVRSGNRLTCWTGPQPSVHSGP